MAETNVAEAPAPIAAVPEQSGMAKFMQDMNATDIAPAETALKPEKQPEKTPERPPEKPPEKQAEKPPAKPAEVKPDADELKTNEQLRNRKNELAAQVKALEKAKADEVTKLTAKIKEYEGKKYYTEDDDKKVQAAESRIKELEQNLSESAYERSADYKQKYTDPWNRTLEGTLGMVEKMKVMADEEGNVRVGTRGDFWHVANLPVEEQSAAAQKLFGANALRVLTSIDKLTDIKQQSDIAIRNHREGLEVKTRESQLRESTEKKLYEERHTAAMSELKEQYPQFFGEDENDPEIAKHMQAGHEFVEKAKAEMPNLSPSDRADWNAVLTMRTESFPRLAYERNLYKSKWEASESELAKYRKSDPGAGKDKGEATPSKSDDEVPTSGAVALARNTKWE